MMTSPNVESLRAVSLFSGYSDAELGIVAGLMDERTVPPGTPIVPNRSPDGAWFVVLAGRGRMLVGEREVATLSPGDSFGEIALVAGKPTRASVEAVTEMTLASVPGARLRELFGIGSIASAALQDLTAGDGTPR